MYVEREPETVVSTKNYEAGKKAFGRRYFEDHSVYREFQGSEAVVLEDWYAVLLRGIEQREGPLLSEGDQVLDAGCGFGSTAAVFDRRGCRVVASDLSEYALGRAAAACALSLVNADITALPFGSASFDAAVAFEVLEHVPSPQHALSELCRVVRPGGLVLATTPNPLSVVLPFIDPWSDETHISVLPRARWASMASAAGLGDVRAWTVMTPPMLWRWFPSRVRAFRFPVVGPTTVLVGRRSVV